MTNTGCTKPDGPAGAAAPGVATATAQLRTT
jgi:hypothetical protein